MERPRNPDYPQGKEIFRYSLAESLTDVIDNVIFHGEHQKYADWLLENIFVVEYGIERDLTVFLGLTNPTEDLIGRVLKGDAKNLVGDYKVENHNDGYFLTGKEYVKQKFLESNGKVFYLKNLLISPNHDNVVHDVVNAGFTQEEDSLRENGMYRINLIKELAQIAFGRKPDVKAWADSIVRGRNNCISSSIFAAVCMTEINTVKSKIAEGQVKLFDYSSGSGNNVSYHYGVAYITKTGRLAVMPGAGAPIDIMRLKNLDEKFKREDFSILLKCIRQCRASYPKEADELLGYIKQNKDKLIAQEE